MAMIMSSGAGGTRGSKQSLSDVLMGDFIPRREPSGGEQLMHDLGMDASSGWSGTPSPNQVGGGSSSYGLPSVGGWDGGGSSYSVAIPEVSMPTQMPVMNTSIGMIPTAPQPQIGQTATMLPTSLENDAPSMIPDKKQEDKPKDESDAKYEDYFRQLGMSEEDINKINERGSWLDVHQNNPATAAVTDNFASYHNPFLDESFDSLKSDIDKTINSLRESGDFGFDQQIPEKYQSDNSDTIGDMHAIDTGRDMDYDHLTADKVTGDAMQKYGELGMGGRDWWEYDPRKVYTKSDEQQDFGFTPYTPDETASTNMQMNQLLDAWGDVAGALGSSRELLTDYGINYDRDGNADTKDDVVRLSGSDWDYRADPYYGNMEKMFKTEPETFLKQPKDGKVHGAPVTTLIAEYELPSADGTTRYAYGSYVDSEAVQDGVTRLNFSGGQSVDVSNDWLQQNGNKLPAAHRVNVEQARDFLPDNLDELNDYARKSGLMDESNLIASAPVLYLPDMVMDDGTRVSWDDFNKIYTDTDVEDNPNTANDDNVSYDTTAYNLDNIPIFGKVPLPIPIPNLAKPRRLMGDMFDEDSSEDSIPIIGSFDPSELPMNAWDMTAGSLPISIPVTQWPVSLAKGLSKSMGGIDPGKYDPLTGSDSYISASMDENGNMQPTYSDVQQVANIATNMLVPATESLAGPLSGHSLIESLSGEIPKNPTLKQLWGNFLLGMLGEGMEEIVGNVFDETGSQGESMYGDVTDDKGNRLLDDNGEPVRNPDGSYKYVNSNGEPMTYMTDETGHIYKDANTPIDRRLMNMVNPNDALNALAGGALVDAVMQSPSVLRQTPSAAKRGMIRKQLGLDPYVETGSEDEMRPFFSGARGARR